MHNEFSPGYVRSLWVQAIEEYIEDLPETNANFEYLLPSTVLHCINQVKDPPTKLPNLSTNKQPSAPLHKPFFSNKQKTITIKITSKKPNNYISDSDSSTATITTDTVTPFRHTTHRSMGTVREGTNNP
jgi:hypothetical protein